MTLLSRVSVERQELSSQFESLVCKLESMSSETKFYIFISFFVMKCRQTCYKIAPDKVKKVPNVDLASSIAVYLYPVFCQSSLYFASLYCSQSFP